MSSSTKGSPSWRRQSPPWTAADSGMAREHPFLLAGEWQRSDRPLEVRSPYNGEVVGVTFVPTEQQVEKAIERAVSGFEQTRRLSSEERARILTRVRDGLARRREGFVRTIG